MTVESRVASLPSGHASFCEESLTIQADDLLEDMEELKSSAKHGLTQTQADLILANMAAIQQAYMAPE